MSQVRATDADGGANGDMFYSLGDDDQSLTQLIDVDEKTGSVRLLAPLDHETHRHLVFTVKARDDGAIQHWDSTEVRRPTVHGEVASYNADTSMRFHQHYFM